MYILSSVTERRPTIRCALTLHPFYETFFGALYLFLFYLLV